MEDERDRLEQQIAFILELDGLKTVLRRSFVLGADRRENSAEHSWQVALAGYVLAEYADEPVDPARVAKMLLLHDVVEIDAGDVPVYDTAARAAKVEEELRAAERIFGLLPDDLGRELRQVWDEYEAARSPEARFAKALDRLLPLLHNARGGGRTWADLGVIESQVREINAAQIEPGSRVLWEFVSAELDRAVAEGLLPRERASRD